MKMRVDEIRVPAQRMRSVIDVDSDEMLELVESIKAVGLLHPITVNSQGFLTAGERRLMAHRILDMELIEVRISDAEPIQVELEENTRRLELPWPDRARGEVRLWNYLKKKDPNWSVKQHVYLTKRSSDKIRTFLRLGEALKTKPHLEGAPSATEALRLLSDEEEREARGDRRLPPEEVHAPDWAKDRYVTGDAFVGLTQLAQSQPQQRGVASHLAFVDPPTRRDWGDDFVGKYTAAASWVAACMHPNSFGLFWFEMEEHSVILSILRKAGWEVSPTPGIWVRHQLTATPKPDTLLGTAFNPFFIAYRGRPRLARTRGNVFIYAEQLPRIAENEKPYTLCREIVRTFLFPGSRVIIPFLGSGNMLRAATNEGHMAFGWELKPEYKGRFLKRVEEDRTKWLHPSGR